MYSRGKPGVLKTFGVPTITPIGWGAGVTQQSQDQSAAFGAALQAAINSGNVGAAATLGMPQGPRQIAVQYGGQQAAQTALIESQIPLAPAQAIYYTGLGQQAASEVPVNNATSGLIQAQTTQQKADTYDQVQGGGIAAQSYTALPYILGGVVVLGIIGWILYYNKASHKQ